MAQKTNFLIFFLYGLITATHLAVAQIPSPAVNTAYTHQGYLILGDIRVLLKQLHSYPELTVDTVTPHTFELYGPPHTQQILQTLQQRQSFLYTPLIPPQQAFISDYPSPEEIHEQLLNIHQEFPHLTKLSIIGESHQYRPIPMIILSSDNSSPSPKRKILLAASIHGDEIVGREVLMRLVNDLCQRYDSDLRIHRLLKRSHIYVIPSINPDGNALVRRGNALHIDLNRNYPDFTTQDNRNTSDFREPETQAIMQLHESVSFVASIVFHGGAEVVNYMWDTQQARHPLNSYLIRVAKNYAKDVEGMWNSQRFPGGVTNGYDWYEVNGGMQDWSNYWYNVLHFTIEISQIKWPAYSEVEKYYNNNYAAILRFLEHFALEK